MKPIRNSLVTKFEIQLLHNTKLYTHAFTMPPCISIVSSGFSNPSTQLHNKRLTSQIFSLSVPFDICEDLYDHIS